MGIWGTQIFADDTAADVRDEFRDLIAEGYSAREATIRLVQDSAEILDDEDEATVFWLALAAIQWRLGRLQEDIRKRALQILNSGTDLQRWKENSKSEQNQRKKHLEGLRAQLLRTPPPPKKIRKVKKSSTDFRAGDIAVYRLDDEIAIRFCVLRTWGDRGGIYTNICLLGYDHGASWKRKSITGKETLGPHFTMLSHEPLELITILARDCKLPKDSNALIRAWIKLPFSRALTWKELPDELREILPQLEW